jgi:hypothetical protein
VNEIALKDVAVTILDASAKAWMFVSLEPPARAAASAVGSIGLADRAMGSLCVRRRGSPDDRDRQKRDARSTHESRLPGG